MITYTTDPATKIMQRFRKSIALFTLASFLLTSVAGQALAALAQEGQEQKKFAGLDEGFILPYTLGRITDAHYAAGDRVVIAIEDLHCHAEVQKNIGGIIAFLDKRFHVPRVYQEGAVGQIDTSWLLSLSDKNLRQSIVDSMLDKGELTGSEYYSVVSGRPRLIQGLEDKKPFEDNVLRLNALLEDQPRMEQELARLKEDLPSLKKTYYGPGNARLERALEKYRKGATDAPKFYGFLRKYAQKNGIDPYAYRNLSSYLDLLESERGLKYPEIARELQDFMAFLKERLPYRVYRSLLEKSDNFSRLDELYLALATLAGDVALSADIPRRFPELSRFFEYLRLSQRVNPVDLVREERKLVREIQLRLSGSESEREVVFVNDYFRLLEEYFSNRISAEDHRYFVQYLPEFRLLWEKHAPGRDLAGLDRFFPVLDEYYRVNVARNRYFLKNLSAESAAKTSPAPAYGDEAAQTLVLLEQGREAAVVVTGGFHTPGLTELLKENGVSYLVITPNVTGETAPAELVYSRVMEEQAKMLAATLAPPLISGAAPFLREQKLVREILDAELREAGTGGDIAGRTGSLSERVNKLLKESLSAIEGTAAVVFVLEELKDGGDCTFSLVQGEHGIRFHYSAQDGEIRAGKDRPAPESPAMGQNIGALVRRALAAARDQLRESMRGTVTFDVGLRDLMEVFEDTSLTIGQKYFYLLAGVHGEYLAPETDIDARSKLLLQRIGAKLEALGFEVDPGNVRLSKQSKTLVVPETGTYGMGTLTRDPATGSMTAVIHQIFLDALDILGPPAGLSGEEMAELFAEHEGYEHQALNEERSEAYRRFTAYLRDGMKIPAGELDENRTTQNFHRSIRFLSETAQKKSHGLNTFDQRLARQAALLEFSEDVVLVEETMRFFQRSYPGRDASLLREMLKFAAERYADTKFPSGESYLRHTLTVARNAAKWGADDVTIAAALTHKMPASFVKNIFGKKGVTKFRHVNRAAADRILEMTGKLAAISRLPYVDDSTVKDLRGGFALDNYMKLVVKLADDDQTMLLVFADKLQTFGKKVTKEEKEYQRQELEHLYVPLAMRLDSYDIAEDLRNGAFRLDNEDEYTRVREEIEGFLKMSYDEAELLLQSMKADIKRGLEEAGVRSPIVKARVKTPYSIWEKIHSSRRAGYDSLLLLKDIMGIHIVVEDADIAKSVEFLAGWLNNNRNFRSLLGENKPIESAENKGLNRYKYNFVDTGSRPYELCIFGARDYDLLQSGFIDETALKSPKPHWIYKLGAAVRTEESRFIQ
ncbi:MAG: HD domain-containing protein, partial [Endomicrobiales bacterium]